MNSDDKKVRYKTILHTVLLVIILLFIIVTICLKHKPKQRNTIPLAI